MIRHDSDPARACILWLTCKRYNGADKVVVVKLGSRLRDSDRSSTTSSSRNVLPVGEALYRSKRALAWNQAVAEARVMVCVVCLRSTDKEGV